MPRQSRDTALPPFLLTRPAPQADRFADMLRQRFGRGLRIVQSPVLMPVFLAPTLPTGVGGVIFSSETGVAGLARLRPPGGLTAWCVGDHTAEVARQAGYAARSAGGDAAALVATIRAEAPQGLLLHARGNESRGAVAETLRAGGILAVDVVVYAQEPAPLTAEARLILAGDGPVVVPLFSPRSATLLAAEVTTVLRPAVLWLVALSAAVADAAAALNPSRQAIAARPDAAALLDAAEALIAAPAQP